MTARGDSFEGQVVMVTGARSGLSRTCAEFFLARGAVVAVHATDPATVQDAGRAVGVPPERCLSGPLHEEGCWKELADRLVDGFGHVDVIVNLPDFDDGGRTDVGLEWFLREGLLSPYFLVRDALPVMERRGYGRVVLSTSGTGFFGLATSPEHSIASAAAVGLLRSAAPTLRSDGVLLNGIAPLNQEAPAVQVASPDPVLYQDRYIVGSVAYLASPSCSLAGEVLSVGAGRIARLFAATTVGVMQVPATAEDIEARLHEILDTAHFVLPGTAIDELLLVEV